MKRMEGMDHFKNGGMDQSDIWKGMERNDHYKMAGMDIFQNMACIPQVAPVNPFMRQGSGLVQTQPMVARFLLYSTLRAQGETALRRTANQPGKRN